MNQNTTQNMVNAVREFRRLNGNVAILDLVHSDIEVSAVVLAEKGDRVGSRATWAQAEILRKAIFEIRKTLRK